MRPSILTIGGGEVELAVRPLATSLPEFRFERRDLEDLAPEDLKWVSPRLLIIAALRKDPALRAFQWLGRHKVSYPLLSVLPEDPDPELLDHAVDLSDDFVIGPARAGELRRRAIRLLEAGSNQPRQVQEKLLWEMSCAQLVGNDPAFLREVERIPACAQSDLPVLITGETGTGKELFARAIHQMSRRRVFPFIPLDCGAIPDHLLENELFGHAQGAFTDAHKEQKGLVALAHRGTLFLDEVDALSLPAQAKLLRLIQEQSYRPLGGERFLRADVKIVAASNRDLEAWVEQKQFRSDLFYRVNVLRLRLPPLRERRQDVALLAEHFLRSSPEGARRSLSPKALELLSSQPWPGNARELLNAVQRALAFAGGLHIEASDFAIGPTITGAPAPAGPGAAGFHEAKKQSIRAFEHSYVADLLQKHNGNITQAAREAGKERRSFGRLVKKYAAKEKRPPDGTTLRHTGSV